MGATTVTGKGPGDSYGTKNDNGGGCCGLGGKAPTTTTNPNVVTSVTKIRTTQGC